MSRTIQIGNLTVNVTKNLFDAVYQIREFLVFPRDQLDDRIAIEAFEPGFEGFRLWVDAICLDQEDNAEKPHQIPLMRHICLLVTNVFVFLGHIGLDNTEVEEVIRIR